MCVARLYEKKIIRVLSVDACGTGLVRFSLETFSLFVLFKKVSYDYIYARVPFFSGKKPHSLRGIFYSSAGI